MTIAQVSNSATLLCITDCHNVRASQTHGPTMLHLQSLQHPVVSASDLSLADGDVVALSGSSGSGKSVFLRCLADLLPANQQMTLNGVPHTAMSAHAWRGRVMYVPAESAWWSNQVQDHFPEYLTVPFSSVGLTEDLLWQDPSRLSSGQRQRLALLRALARNPSVLLLDEPTANLDEKTAEQVEATLQHWAGKGVAILFASHDARQRKRLASRLWRVQNGTVEEQAW